MTDERGVLGNLPHSRPGQRSEKRVSQADGAEQPGRSGPGKTKSRATAGARKSTRTAKPVKGAKPESKAKARTARPTPAAQTPPARENTTTAGSNPVGEVVRTVSSLAGGGARAARGLAREVFRRLPRP